MTGSGTLRVHSAGAGGTRDDHVRVGVIGLGRMGLMHAENATRISGLRVVAAADPREPARAAAAQRLGADGHADWQELVERKDVDAVLICSPAPATPGRPRRTPLARWRGRRTPTGWRYLPSSVSPPPAASRC